MSFEDPKSADDLKEKMRQAAEAEAASVNQAREKARAEAGSAGRESKQESAALTPEERVFFKTILSGMKEGSPDDVLALVRGKSDLREFFSKLYRKDIDSVKGAKAAVRKLLMKYHLDRHGNGQSKTAEDITKLLNRVDGLFLNNEEQFSGLDWYRQAADRDEAQKHRERDAVAAEETARAAEEKKKAEKDDEATRSADAAGSDPDVDTEGLMGGRRRGKRSGRDGQKTGSGQAGKTGGDTTGTKTSGASESGADAASAEKNDKDKAAPGSASGGEFGGSASEKPASDGAEGAAQENQKENPKNQDSAANPEEPVGDNPDTGAKAETPEDRIAKLMAEVADLRESYAQDEFNIENMFSRSRNILGKNAGQKPESEIYTEYKKKVAELRDAEFERIRRSGLKGEDLDGELKQALIYFNYSEGKLLLDAHDDLRRRNETWPGKVVGSFENLGRWYNALPPNRKWMLAAGLMTLSLGAAVTGSLVMGGAASMAILASRIAGGSGIGVMTDAGLEKLSDKRQRIKSEKQAERALEGSKETAGGSAETEAMFAGMIAASDKSIAELERDLQKKQLGNVLRKATAVGVGVGTGFFIRSIVEHLGHTDTAHAIKGAVGSVWDHLHGAPAGGSAAHHLAGNVAERIAPVGHVEVAHPGGAPDLTHDLKIPNNFLSDHAITAADGKKGLWGILEGRLPKDLPANEHNKVIAAFEKLINQKVQTMTPDQLKAAGFPTGNIDQIYRGGTLRLGNVLTQDDVAKVLSGHHLGGVHVAVEQATNHAGGAAHTAVEQAANDAHTAATVTNINGTPHIGSAVDHAAEATHQAAVETLTGHPAFEAALHGPNGGMIRGWLDNMVPGVDAEKLASLKLGDIRSDILASRPGHGHVARLIGERTGLNVRQLNRIVSWESMRELRSGVGGKIMREALDPRLGGSPNATLLDFVKRLAEATGRDTVRIAA